MQRSEKGFTLIEVLISLAIMSIIMLAMTMTVTALLTHPQQSTEHNVVLQQVQNAGYWVSRDVQMAKSVTLTEPSGFPLTLDIPLDTDVNNDYTVDYLFDGNKLKRQVYDSLGTLTAEMMVAEYIDPAATTFSAPDPSIDNLYNLTVKASKGETVVERSYQISQRPSSG